MNIIELNKNEIAFVSGGGAFWTIALANVGAAAGYLGAQAYLYAQSLRKTGAPTTEIIKQTALYMFFGENAVTTLLKQNVMSGVKAALYAAYNLAWSCAIGTAVGCCIAYPLSLIGLVRIN